MFRFFQVVWVSESIQMTLNGYEKWAEPVANNSSPCGYDMTSWEQNIEIMYTYFYLLVFIPGFLFNTTALWVLCRHVRYSQSHQNPASKVLPAQLTPLHLFPQ